MSHIVYCLTNACNGKKYIGITSKTLNRRFSQHCACAKRGTKGKLYCAMRKYGIDKFRAEIVELLPTRAEALSKEVDLIMRMDTFKNGYNSSLGGDGGSYDNLDANSQKAVRDAHRVRAKAWSDQRSPEEMDALRKRVCQQWKEFTPEQKKLMSKKMASRRAKRYVVTSPDGQIFDVVDLKAFCNEHGLHQGQLCGVANGRYKHCKNWTARHFDK